jgi:phosphosulfolactate synthase
MRKKARMHATALDLPTRPAKPRSDGRTLVIDPGLPLGLFCDLLGAGSEYIDAVKFGWGTSVVTGQLAAKIRLLESLDIDWFFGGTLFEKHVAQGRVDEYRRWCDSWGARLVEVSNGTLEMSNTEKAGYIALLSSDYTVISEVGHKQPERAERLTSANWADYVRQDLEAGAESVILEAREAGTIGIAAPDGRLRCDLLDDVLATGVSPTRLVVEAPTKVLQAGVLGRLGPNANLGNIAAGDVLGLETLRLGLRSDTFDCFDASSWSRPTPTFAMPTGRG